jgi:hypothetical protein
MFGSFRPNLWSSCNQSVRSREPIGHLCLNCLQTIALLQLVVHLQSSAPYAESGVSLPRETPGFSPGPKLLAHLSNGEGLLCSGRARKALHLPLSLRAVSGLWMTRTESELEQVEQISNRRTIRRNVSIARRGGWIREIDPASPGNCSETPVTCPVRGLYIRVKLSCDELQPKP